MIKDFSELVVEVQRRTSTPGLVNKADFLTHMAETQIERVLRVRQMETISDSTAVLNSASDAEFDVPTRYLDTRDLFYDGKRVERISLEAFERGEKGHCVVGGKFLVPQEGDYRLYYYDRLPSIVDNNTNWLLEADSEVYIAALSFQTYSDAGNLEAAQAAGAYLGGLLQSMNDQDAYARFSGASMDLKGARK